MKAHGVIDFFFCTLAAESLVKNYTSEEMLSTSFMYITYNLVRVFLFIFLVCWVFLIVSLSVLFGFPSPFPLLMGRTLM